MQGVCAHRQPSFFFDTGTTHLSAAPRASGISRPGHACGSAQPRRHGRGRATTIGALLGVTAAIGLAVIPLPAAAGGTPGGGAAAGGTAPAGIRRGAVTVRETIRQQLALLSRERDEAHALVASLHSSAADGDPLLDVMLATATDLDSRVAMLRAKLAALDGNASASAAAQASAATRPAATGRRSADASPIRRWIGTRMNAVKQVLASSGVDVDQMMQRAGHRLTAGQGGPLEAVPAPAVRGRTAVALRPGLGDDLDRLRAMHALLRAMPLVAPLDVYQVTSGFGPRHDPITGRRAFHPGLDLGGVHQARVEATAPGKVLVAGREGAYGIIVEIDHGMGIHTRYAHLRRTLVHVGQTVRLGQAIGITGSTGRSTGEHVHYEVRVDGTAYDPEAFLEAGSTLRTAFAN